MPVERILMSGKIERVHLEAQDLEAQLDDIGRSTDWTNRSKTWETIWTAKGVLSLLEKSHFDLAADFQRGPTWNQEQQSRFIESLILGLPAPRLIVAEGRQEGDPLIVIDGRQFLLAIRRFDPRSLLPDAKPLRLSGLTALRNLNGKTIKTLERSPAPGKSDLRKYANAFARAKIIVVIIRDWKDEGFLYGSFLRSGSEGKSLSSQHLRQALHPGKFTKFLQRRSAASKELQKLLNLEGPDPRMRDAEIMLRYLAYRNFMEEYDGNLKMFLDDATCRLNESWKSAEGKIREQVRQMNDALKFTRRIFGESSYLRESDGREYTGNRNRSVIDIMLHYFSLKDVRKSLSRRAGEVEEKFLELCRDGEFRSSLGAGAKSVRANRIRFNRWGEALEGLCGLDLSNAKFPATP